MTIRERQERDEEARLSPYAALSSRSAGRAHPISTCDLRTCYQRDRDRIIHCKSFRRLKYKTQVFLTPMGDHYEQSLRVAERLENDGQGLNLCRETLDGILNHSGQNEPKTLEGWCVRRADRIAYINHDLDDAIRGGILKPFELPRRCLSVLGETHGERIDTMIRDIVTTSMDQPFVRMSEEVRQASEELRAFLFEYVYHDEWRKKEEARCDYILSALYEHYLAHPEQLPAEYLEINFTEGAERAVCDFIACMTDRYAIDQFSEIFVPGAFGRR